MDLKAQVLELVRDNARISAGEMAAQLGVTAEAAAAALRELEQEGVIRGYRTIINEEKAPSTKVKALIEVKVTPTRDGGFDRVASRIAKFPEVTELYLLSGSFDLLLTVEGDTLQQVAGFVASKLATIDGVNSTSTGFMLKKYKVSGVLMQNSEEYERLKVCF